MKPCSGLAYPLNNFSQPSVWESDIHMISKTIFEVRRILLEHLHDVDSGNRLAHGKQRLVRPVRESLELGGAVHDRLRLEYVVVCS